MLNAKLNICPGEWDYYVQTDHRISARRPDLILIDNNKKNMQNCGLCCPGWSQRKIERKWKKDKYFDLARGFNRMGNMKVTFIPIVIGALCTVIKG